MRNSEILEDRLLAEIAEVDRKLNELTKERDTLNRMLLKARQANVHLRDVKRKNSLNRILVEKAVLVALSTRKNPVAVRILRNAAKDTVYDLSEVNFRTRLHRMQKDGLIEPVSRGFWSLPSKKPTSTHL